MREAYRRTRKDGATGIDGQTAVAFAEDLDENLKGLLNATKSGSYRAPPVRRAYIPKASGKPRPIGIPTFGDKVLQRAVVQLIEPIFESDFVDSSYGFRPGRSAHDATDALWRHTMDVRGGTVIELDIKSFFDSMIPQEILRMVRQRIRDGVILRLIAKWLKAGVLKGAQYERTRLGAPQGSVISPLLGNIYLHEVLDVWFEKVVKPRLRGRAHLVRYADDAALVFEYESDARRVFDVLPQRFAKYGLELHPEKTRLVRFKRPRIDMKPSISERPETFDFLGFTHYWGRSRSGKGVVKQKTARDRFRRALKAIKIWCKVNRHWKVRAQWRGLNQKLRGHYAYFGVSGNFNALLRFQAEVKRIWKKWLGRRSHQRFSWIRWSQLYEHYPLPNPRIYHRST